MKKIVTRYMEIQQPIETRVSETVAFSPSAIGRTRLHGCFDMDSHTLVVIYLLATVTWDFISKKLMFSTWKVRTNGCLFMLRTSARSSTGHIFAKIIIGVIKGSFQLCF